MRLPLWLILLSKYDFCLVFKKQSDFPSLLWHMYVLLFSLKYYHKTYAFWHPSLKPLFFLIVKENYEGGHSHLPPTLECWKYFTMYQISPARKKWDPVLSVYPWTFLASRKKFKYQQSVSTNLLHTNISVQEQSYTLLKRSTCASYFVQMQFITEKILSL